MNKENEDQPRFSLGQIVATPCAMTLLERASVNALTLIMRHVTGDWGVVPDEDRAANDEAVRTGARVLSSYCVGDDTIWIITEADRSVTTVLMPSDY